MAIATILITSLDTTIQQQLDASLDELAEGEERWAATGLLARAKLLRETMVSAAANADEWVTVACQIKQIPADSQYVSEELVTGPFATLRGLDAIAETLELMATGKNPLDNVKLGTAPGGRVAVQALPRTPQDHFSFSGFKFEVWMRPELTAAAVRASAGLGSKDPSKTSGVGLVLGAGNITSIGPLDAVYQLVAENRVVLFKSNPNFDPLTPVLEKAFAPLIEHGALRFASGGPDVGSYLTGHPKIGHVHVTGSLATHDAIAFGPGEDGAQRKQSGTPNLGKPITSELGGVAPLIIVPGKWSAADIKYQAENTASQRMNNCGHNCNGTQVLILSSDWAQKDEFLDALRAVLNELPYRPPWYPGAPDRLAAIAERTNAERLGPGEDRLLIDLDAGDETDFSRTEAFASALGVQTLPGTGTKFIEDAVAHANDKLFGTLSSGLIIDPRTRRELSRPLEELIEPLEYGSIGVNLWGGIAFAIPHATWGAFPKHTVENNESGIGIVHNAFLLEGVERTVAFAPFRPFPRSLAGGELAFSGKPFWFVTHRTAVATAQRLVDYAADPTWVNLGKVAAVASRG